MTTGARHSCAVDYLGLLTCWGSNAYGQTDTARPYLSSAGVPSLNPIYCEVGDYHNGDPEVWTRPANRIKMLSMI